jgi:alcohol dehydrogenase class IV
MANAATIAGLGFGNSYAGLAHAMGHSFGAYFKVPHGRTVGLFLPYTMEFTARGGLSRYGDIARFIGLTDSRDEALATAVLVEEIRQLERRVEQPTTVGELNIAEGDFMAALATIVPNAEIDNGILAAPRMPETEELQQLFEYAYWGRKVDF